MHTSHYSTRNSRSWKISSIKPHFPGLLLHAWYEVTLRQNKFYDTFWSLHFVKGTTKKRKTQKSNVRERNWTKVCPGFFFTYTSTFLFPSSITRTKFVFYDDNQRCLGFSVFTLVRLSTLYRAEVSFNDGQAVDQYKKVVWPTLYYAYACPITASRRSLQRFDTCFIEYLSDRQQRNRRVFFFPKSIKMVVHPITNCIW